MNTSDEIKERISKSQAKRDATAIHAFALRLTRLTAKQRSQLDLPDEIDEALDALTQIRSNSARSRQIKYVGVLIRRSERCVEIMALNLDQF